MRYVWDTELTVGAGRCSLHVVSKKDRPRLTDGVRHPVKVIKAGKVAKRGSGSVRVLLSCG